MTELEQRLRAGFAQRAEHAVPAQAVLDRLAATEHPRRPAIDWLRRQVAPVRHNRQTGLWLAVGAGVVVAALGLSMAVRVSGDHQPPATRPTPTSVRLTMGVGWLPAGFTEWYRAANADGSVQIRRWVETVSPKAGHSPPTVILENVTTADPNVNRRLDINTAAANQAVRLPSGRQADLYVENATNVSVTLHLGYNHVIILQANDVPDARDLAPRIADSIGPDAHATVTSGMSFGQLPAGVSPTMSVVVGLTRQHPSSGLTAMTFDAPWHTGIVAWLGYSQGPTVSAASPILVRGRMGVYVTNNQPGTAVWVQLQDGRWLEISCDPNPGGQPLSETALVRIADGITIGTPDYSWMPPN